jgi:hypothetical protein
MKDAAEWVEHYRRFWAGSFDRLDDYLHRLKDKEQTHARKRRKTE